MADIFEMFSLLCVIFATLLIGLDFYLRSQPHYKAALRIPGPRMLPIIGNFWMFVNLSAEQSIRLTIDMAKRTNGGYKFYGFGVLHYWPNRAHEIEFLFNSAKYTEKSFLYAFLHPMIGVGLLCSDSKKWSHRRRILTPAFHFNILQQFLSIFIQESKRFVRGLNDDHRHSIETNLEEIIPRFTLNNICETAMGVKLNDQSDGDEYRHNLDTSGKLITGRVINPIYYFDIIFKRTKMYRDIMWYTDKIHTFSKSVIDRRRKSYQLAAAPKSEINETENIYQKKNRYAMLDTLLEAEANGGHIDNSGILEEVETFMFEGYDTTSTGIAFLLFVLAQYQDVQQNLYDEIVDEIDGLNGGETTMHKISNMKYFDRVIKETFRLYPPVPYLSRRLDEKFVSADNMYLPKHTQVHVFLYNLHRDPEQFPDPEKFDPDRFLNENVEKRHPFSYIPFSAGPRNCIGQKFALLEIKTLIAEILLQYELHPITKLEDIVFVSDLVLRSKNPIKIKFQKRHITSNL